MQETLTMDTAPLIDAPAVAPVCECGSTLAPSGACLEVGACERADLGATRGASRATAKYAIPAAWSSSGRTD